MRREVKKLQGADDDALLTAPYVPDVEPYGAEVDGAKLLDDLVAVVREHLVTQPEAADAIALWVLAAHSHDANRHSPILLITSPVHECGKTTTATIVKHTVPRWLGMSNLTPAVVYQAIAAWGPTLLLAEVDSFW